MATLTNARQHRMRTRSRSARSEEHTSELQSQSNLVCRLLLEKKKNLAHFRVHGEGVSGEHRRLLEDHPFDLASLFYLVCHIRLDYHIIVPITPAVTHHKRTSA